VTWWGFCRVLRSGFLRARLVGIQSTNDYEPEPIFYIKLVNTGRRPIVLVEIEKKNRNQSWRNPLGLPKVDAEGMAYDSNKLREAFSTKHTSVILKEAEYFEQK